MDYMLNLVSYFINHKWFVYYPLYDSNIFLPDSFFNYKNLLAKFTSSNTYSTINYIVLFLLLDSATEITSYMFSLFTKFNNIS
jgi:hypothetical protein